MNHKLIISRVALSSALLLATVASPALSYAASPTKPVELQTMHKTIASDAIQKDQAFAIVNSFTDPLELAEKYAPDTLNDWKKTLEKYENTIGATAKVSFTKMEAEPGDSITLDAVPVSKLDVIPSSIAVKSSAAGSASITIVKSDSIKAEDGMKIVPSVASITTTAAVTSEIKDADLTFIQAEIKLAKAVQAKDTNAIKQSLNELLAAYKQQIADWETSK